MTNESARLDPPKIEFSCTCGKKYRVKAEKAGAKMRCKRCEKKIRVPRAFVSGRSRAAILEELGIDPKTAREGYEAELAREKDLEEAERLAYRCARCEAEIPGSELKDSYCEDGLLCSICRPKDVRAKMPAVAIFTAEPPEKSVRVALQHFALFLAGFAGPLYTFAHLRWYTALLIMLPIAACGATLVYRARRNMAAAGPEPERKSIPAEKIF